VNPSAGPARVLKGTVTMSKKKTVKRTSAPRTAHRPKVDPRLVRVSDVLGEIWDRVDEGRDPIGAERALFEVVLRHLNHRGVFDLMLKTAVDENKRNGDLDVALDEMLAIAEDEHRAHCACCRERHEKTAAAS
jgi:hypothetical protein